VTAPPYSYVWSGVPPWTYSLTAIAYDNYGASTTSAAVTAKVTLKPLAQGVFFIEPDHLNTPRAIKNQNDTVVWQWNSDPFGKATPNEDPDGDGVKFEYNLRFPGQVFDKETGLNYNWHRNYDPGTGRYIESDPIGLMGGLNTYGYVGGNPYSFVDPMGLARICVITPFGPTCWETIPPSNTGGSNTWPSDGSSTIYNNDSADGDNARSRDNLRDRPQRCEDDKKPDCRKASSWDLKQAGITDEHAYKTDHGAVPWSSFDICKCKDGTIRIARVGQCGKTNKFWD